MTTTTAATTEAVPSTFDTVKKIIVKSLGVDEDKVTPGTMLVDDIGADSLDMVELVMESEEAFGIEIPDADAEKITTVQSAVELIDRLKAERS